MKKDWTALLVIFLWLVSICFFYGCKGSEKKSTESALKHLGGKTVPIHEIESAVEKLMKKGGVTGLSCAVINDSRIVYTKAFGYKHKKQQTLIDEQTVFSAASFSKTIFAYLVMKLMEEGRVDLDKPLYEYLSQPLYDYANYADFRDDDRYKKITARIALSHQTGFPNWRFLTEDKKLTFLFDPGSRYSYSGEGIALLQMVIEEIMGQGLEALAREKVFVPLMMTRTSYSWQEAFEDNFAFPHDEFERHRRKDKRDEADAAGSMQTTAEDYARLLVDILQAINLSKAMVDGMITPQIKISSERMFGPGVWRETEDNEDINLSWCLGWGRFDSKHGRAFFHTGHEFGFQNYTVTYADAGIGIVLLSNSDNFEGVGREIVKAVIGEDESPFDWLGYESFDPSRKKTPPPEKKAVDVDPEILAGYVGEYEIKPDQKFTVKLEGGHLFVSSEKGRWTEILPESVTTFFVEDSDYVLTFKRNESGRVTSLILSIQGIELKCQKLR